MRSTAQPIAELCERRPLALALLYRRGIDASEPNVTLDAACTARGLDVTAWLAELEAEERKLVEPLHALDVHGLIDHLLRTYHGPLAHELAAFEACVRASRDGSDATAWNELVALAVELRVDMEQHMKKEESVLFPWLRARAATAAAPMRAMQLEHGDTLGLLHAVHRAVERCLRKRSDTTAVSVAMQTAHVERILCEHMHLENNELLARALERASSPR
jgi:iron-sulfur cluster repair protein YtfE (RIC family)